MNGETSLPAGHEGRENDGVFVRRVGREIARLPPGDWEILFMCVVGKMHYEEIAVALSMPVESVRQRVRQVREGMRARLFSESGAAGLPRLQPAAKTAE